MLRFADEVPRGDGHGSQLLGEPASERSEEHGNAEKSGRAEGGAGGFLALEMPP
jgi:hypothetical protein